MAYVKLMYARNSAIDCSGGVAVLGQGGIIVKFMLAAFINGECAEEQLSENNGAAVKGLTRIVVLSDQTIQAGFAKKGSMMQLAKSNTVFQKDEAALKRL